jgi:hypothetical protein
MLWVFLNSIHLQEEIEESIVWNIMPSGEYPSKSAYKAQFFEATTTSMNMLVWKSWAPPKIKFFAWLAIRNRLWTADHL